MAFSVVLVIIVFMLYKRGSSLLFTVSLRGLRRLTSTNAKHREHCIETVRPEMPIRDGCLKVLMA